MTQRREQDAGQHGDEGDAGAVLARVHALLDAEDDVEERELVEAVAEAADDLAVPEAREIFFAQDGAEGGRVAVGGHAGGRGRPSCTRRGEKREEICALGQALINEICAAPNCAWCRCKRKLALGH